jgi:hypothetical protein
VTIQESPPEPAASSLACPQCGGTVPVGSGDRIAICGFCGKALYIDRGLVVSHYWLRRILDAEGATAALRRWMAGNETVKDLDRRSEIEALDPVSFPLWLFRRQVGGGGEAVVEPAAPIPIPQIADLQIPAGQLLGADPAAGEAIERVEPTVPLETARGWLDQRGDGAISESSLVRVPLWRARYRFAGSSYLALVDGSTGQVLASVFPEKKESPYVLVAILGLVLFGIEGFAITHPIAKLVAYAVSAVPLGALAWWVSRRV